MVFVEVKVPVLCKTYDFKLDRKAKIKEVMNEIIDSVCKKEGCRLCETYSPFLLWDTEKKRILPGDWTVTECGITTGQRLLLG